MTGGARGIGKTIARVLAQQGMRVGINDVNLAVASDTVEEFRKERLVALGVG